MKFILPKLITAKGSFCVTRPVLDLTLNTKFNFQVEIEEEWGYVLLL